MLKDRTYFCTEEKLKRGTNRMGIFGILFNLVERLGVKSTRLCFCVGKKFCKELSGAVLWLFPNMNGGIRCNSKNVDRCTGNC